MRILKASVISLLLGTLLQATALGQTSTVTLPSVGTWLGNTFGNATSLPASPFNPIYGTWVQQDGDYLYTDPNGTCFVATRWDEGGHPVSWYQNGALIGAQRNGTIGWGWGNCSAVVADSTYVYVAETEMGGQFTGTNTYGNPMGPPLGQGWVIVSRQKRSPSETTAPFNGAYGRFSNEMVINVVSTGTSGSAEQIPENRIIGGLGIDTTRQWLYVSDPLDTNSNGPEIKVYNTAAMTGSSTPLYTYSLSNPGQIAVAADDSIWVIQPAVGSTPGDVVHLTVSSSGSFTPTGTITDCADPSGIAIAPGGNILIGDHGTNNQVRIYNSSGVFQSALGNTGGIYSGTRGQVAPLKFNGISGVGTDNSGNIYVAQKGAMPSGSGWGDGFGFRLESYTSGGTQNWDLHGLEWVDNAEPDPASETDVFTPFQHFTMDYTKDTGQGLEATYADHTIDPYTYPDDPRLHVWNGGNGFVSAVGVRRIGGQRFLFETGMGSSFVGIYRFGSGSNIAIPCAFITQAHITPATGDNWPPGQPSGTQTFPGWIWRDGSDGSTPDGAFQASEFQLATAKYQTSSDQRGMWVDSSGDVWWTNSLRNTPPYMMSFYEFVCQGLDANGIPIYDYNHVRTFTGATSATSTLTSLGRVAYIPSTDTLYLTGYTTASPDPGGQFGKVGTVIDAYPNWTSMTGTTTTTGTFTGKLTPAWEAPIAQTGTATSPQYLPFSFSVAGHYAFVGYFNDGALFSDKVGVYDLNNHGNYLGNLQPGANLGRNLGDTDQAWAIRAFQRGNGEYVIFHEDDRYAKVAWYRWLAPANTFTNPWGNYVATTLPSAATPAWSYSSGSGTPESSVSSLVNVVVNTGTSTTGTVTTYSTGTVSAVNMNTTASGSITFAYGARGSFNFNEANGYTVEFSAQCDSYSGVGLGVDQGFSMKVFGPTYMMEASINTTQLCVRGGNTYTLPSGKTYSGAPHLFRFIKHAGNALYDVYVDGVLLEANATALVNGVPGGMINFGDSSGGSSCNATLYDVYADTSGAK